jgi:uncharacterized protein YigA (DUF484 family)
MIAPTALRQDLDLNIEADEPVGPGSPPGEDTVAQYIADHPDLFRRRPSLLAAIDLPDPHDGHAASLGQRQTLILRERVRALEASLAELVHRGRENDVIDERVTRWSARLLTVGAESELPGQLVEALEDVFDIPAAAVRLWDVASPFAALPCAAAVSADVVRFADSMLAPYCGPNSDFAAAGWLAAGAEPIRSLAMIALRNPGGEAPAARAFGLLVLGSPDPQRFRSDMGTEFLARVGALAAAALSRLLG